MMRPFGNDALPAGGNNRNRGARGGYRGSMIGGGSSGSMGQNPFAVNIPANPLTPKFLDQQSGQMRTNMAGDPMGLSSGPVYSGGGAVAGMPGLGSGASTGAARQVSPPMAAFGQFSPGQQAALGDQQRALADANYFPAANSMWRWGNQQGAEYELASQIAKAGIGRQNQALDNSFLGLQLNAQQLANPLFSTLFRLLSQGLG